MLSVGLRWVHRCTCYRNGRMCPIRDRWLLGRHPCWKWLGNEVASVHCVLQGAPWRSQRISLQKVALQVAASSDRAWSPRNIPSWLLWTCASVQGQSVPRSSWWLLTSGFPHLLPQLRPIHLIERSTSQATMCVPYRFQPCKVWLIPLWEVASLRKTCSLLSSFYFDLL